MVTSTVRAVPTSSRVHTPFSVPPMLLVWECMTPRQTKLEEVLKVSSKFSKNFLQKPESACLFSLDTIEHMGYDEGVEPHQRCGHSWTSDLSGHFLKSCCARAFSRERGRLARLGAARMAALPGIAQALLGRCARLLIIAWCQASAGCAPCVRQGGGHDLCLR
jgi:hypothetical protein